MGFSLERGVGRVGGERSTPAGMGMGKGREGIDGLAYVHLRGGSCYGASSYRLLLLCLIALRS